MSHSKSPSSDDTKRSWSRPLVLYAVELVEVIKTQGWEPMTALNLLDKILAAGTIEVGLVIILFVHRVIKVCYVSFII